MTPQFLAEERAPPMAWSSASGTHQGLKALATAARDARLGISLVSASSTVEMRWQASAAAPVSEAHSRAVVIDPGHRKNPWETMIGHTCLDQAQGWPITTTRRSNMRLSWTTGVCDGGLQLSKRGQVGRA